MTERSITIRRRKLIREIDAIEATLEHSAVADGWLRSGRYLASLLKANDTGEMRDWLRFYRDFLQSRSRS